jgi:hypothetical protein
LNAVRRAPLLLILCAACAGVSFPDTEPADGDIAPLVPAKRAAKLRQRWLLRRGGTELAFTMYVRVTPPDTVHYVALEDLGGTLAEATNHEVKRSSRAIPERLAAAIAADLRVLLLPTPRYRTVRTKPDGHLAAERDGELRTEGAVYTPRVRITRTRDAPGHLEFEGVYRASVESR